MAVEAATKSSLYDAATNGDVATLKQVLQKDPCLLDEIWFARSRNVLHIATMRGQVSIVEEVLKINPELARDVDCTKSPSLHIAAAQGHVEIASKLLAVAPEMCWWLDDQGMNSIHIAAMKGHVEILKELLQKNWFPAMERVHRGQTVLHLCVKHSQLEALKVLVDKLGELVCAKDDDGETILHLAVRCNQFEMIRYLVKSSKINQQTLNSTGKTALGVLSYTSPDLNTYIEISKMLVGLSNEHLLQIFPKFTDITMVVVVLIATMAFQAAVSPPGDVWQDDTSSHRAGKAVMASTHPKLHKHFVRANTTAFVSSLITIFLVSTGGPSWSFSYLAIATFAMWVSLASIGVSYGASMAATTPARPGAGTDHIVATVVCVSLSCIASLLLHFFFMRSYRAWKMETRLQQDLTTAPLISRGIYRFFQLLEKSHKYVMGFRLPLLRSDSPPSRDTASQVA